MFLRLAQESVAGINWGDEARIKVGLDYAIGYIEKVAAQDMGVLSQALTTCTELWNNRPLGRARFQKLVDEEFAKRRRMR